MLPAFDTYNAHTTHKFPFAFYNDQSVSHIVYQYKEPFLMYVKFSLNDNTGIICDLYKSDKDAVICLPCAVQFSFTEADQFLLQLGSFIRDEVGSTAYNGIADEL